MLITQVLSLPYPFHPRGLQERFCLLDRQRKSLPPAEIWAAIRRDRCPDIGKGKSASLMTTRIFSKTRGFGRYNAFPGRVVGAEIRFLRLENEKRQNSHRCEFCRFCC